jgi:DNA polymerase-3 subunit beta
MEFTIERDAFIKSLSKVQGIVEKRNAMPILSNSLLKAKDGQLEVIATDLDVTIMDKCPVDLAGEGSLTLNAKKLYDIVKELPEGPVFFGCDEEYHVEVKSGKVRFELMGISPEGYPKIPDPSDFNFVKVPGKKILDMIQKTIYATAGEEARFSLNGIFTEKSEDGKSLRMVATDGHRLAMTEDPIENLGKMKLSSGVIMPKKGMGEAAKLLMEIEGEIGLAIKDKQAAMSFNDTTLVMRLVDGRFPDYKRVIIEGCDKVARVKKEDLVRNLRRVSIMVDEKARAVKFTFGKKSLALESKNPNFGSSFSELEIEYDSEQIVIAFNDRYFNDIMNAGKGDAIVIELKDGQSPAIVKMSEEANYTCVVMPMRL